MHADIILDLIVEHIAELMESFPLTSLLVQQHTDDVVLLEQLADLNEDPRMTKGGTGSKILGPMSHLE